MAIGGVRILSSKLDPILSPRSVAVIGAGRNPTSMSGRLYRNLRDSFRGPVYAINPHAGTIDAAQGAPLGARCSGAGGSGFHHGACGARVRGCARVRTKRGPRAGGDLRGILRGGCHRPGPPAGASRSGPPIRNSHGRPQLLRRAEYQPAVSLRGVFSPIEVHRGNVAFGSQSGSLGVVIPARIGRWQLGLSSFVSIGNKADVGENDLLLYWECDPATQVIALYLESFQDPPRFLDHARRISYSKPIVVLKAGRTEAGRQAASSHTAALASQDAAADALFRQAGVIRAETLEELFDIAALLSSQPVPTGRRVAVLGNAGGPAVLCGGCA